MIFQKRPRCQEKKYQFTINNHIIEHSMSYIYLGITITASGTFNMTVNALKEKAPRALNAIKRTVYNFQIPIKIRLNIFDSVIQPIVLYGSEVWGPLSIAIPVGINIQQNLYMQNSADTFYTYTEKHQQMYVEQN